MVTSDPDMVSPTYDFPETLVISHRVTLTGCYILQCLQDFLGVLLLVYPLALLVYFAEYGMHVLAKRSSVYLERRALNGCMHFQWQLCELVA